MKRSCLHALFMVFLMPVFAAAQDRPSDLVIVLDTSASMFAHYSELGPAVIEPLVRSKLSSGDTAHIISFSDDARLELSRKIEGPGDIETLATHLFLLYPLNPWSDVVKALDWTAQYLTRLPSGRQKQIVFISDGEHLPPPGSPNAALGPDEARARIEQSARDLKGNGWEFHYVKTPWPAASSKAPASADPLASGGTAASPGTPAASGTTASGASGTDTSSRPTVGSPKAASGAGTTTSFSDASDPLSTGTPEGRGSGGSGVTTDPAGDNAAKGEGQPPIADARGPDGGLDTSATVADALPAEIHTVETDDNNSLKPLVFDELWFTWPSDIGKTAYRFKIPVRVKNPGATMLLVECHELIHGNHNILEKPLMAKIPAGREKKLSFQVVLDSSFKPGVQELLLVPVFTGTTRITPAEARIAINLEGTPVKKTGGRLFTAGLLIAGILAALIIAVVILLLFRKSLASPAQAVYRSANRQSDGLHVRSRTSALQDRQTTSTPTKSPTETARDSSVPASRAETTQPLSTEDKRGTIPVRQENVAASYPPPAEDFPVRAHEERIMLSLFVDDQNTAIGRRNVHMLKAGGKLSLGGGNSDFLVFLVRFPERIAKVHFDGLQCHLTIHRPEFFPGIEGTTVEDCIGKRIDLVSSKGYKLWFRIDRFEDPLEKLNNFLRSIEHRSIGL